MATAITFKDGTQKVFRDESLMLNYLKSNPKHAATIDKFVSFDDAKYAENIVATIKGLRVKSDIAYNNVRQAAVDALINGATPTQQFLDATGEGAVKVIQWSNANNRNSNNPEVPQASIDALVKLKKPAPPKPPANNSPSTKKAVDKSPAQRKLL